MREITVRVAGPADTASVSAILQNSYPALMAPFYEPDLLAAVLPKIVRAQPALLASGRYHVAIADNGLAVGCGGWTHEAPGSGETQAGLGHLRHFGTRADWAGRGVGRAVYDRCEQQARDQRVTVLMCYANLNAVGFYNALGFDAVGERGIPMGGGIVLPAMVMRRGLSKHP